MIDQADRTIKECRPTWRGRIRPVHSFHLLTLDLAWLVDIAWLETEKFGNAKALSASAF